VSLNNSQTGRLENHYILKGEKMADPADPCTAYYCKVNLLHVVSFSCTDQIMRSILFACLLKEEDLQLLVLITTCNAPESCADGKSPYKLPGTCCPACSKSEHTQLQSEPH